MNPDVSRQVALVRGIQRFKSLKMPLFPRLLIALAALSFAAAVHAEPVTPAVRAEIDVLLEKLSASGCLFNRNGSWHSAVEAQSHLLNKLGHLEGRDLVQTTEQFIERGASGSSVSGKPYLVKCGSAAAVPSQLWLSVELKVLRGAAKPPAATKH
jgi:hypothetical protein